MNYTFQLLSVIVFGLIVATVLFISFFFARKSKSAKGYFAAGGSIPWHVNGIAFAGDYLSAASFLGICGMIATKGYDGFLYSIGYLSGWVVALFIVAEPLKRMGKYTFTDALDSRFNSKGIQLMAGISTLVVSIFYLIPQMVGAGSLITPLLGLPHWVGVIGVGVIVITIVATAGMTSTTYVQFIKGGLLIIFSLILTFAILHRGLTEEKSDSDHYVAKVINYIEENDNYNLINEPKLSIVDTVINGKTFLLINDGTYNKWFFKDKDSHSLIEVLSVTEINNGDNTILYNGAEKKPKEPLTNQFYQVGKISNLVTDSDKTEKYTTDGIKYKKTGAIGPFKYLSTINKSVITLYKKNRFEYTSKDGFLNKITVWYPEQVDGKKIMTPGQKFPTKEPMQKINFISLMLALFFGTSALPHVLIRYYTVPKAKDARKSTILAILAIGFFYILTIYIGLGAMTNGAIDVTDGNMSAPLLAQRFSLLLFAIISAIAFATVLGTVSGLIVASSGAVAHDLIDNFLGIGLSDKKKVMIGKISAIVVGVFAIILGILFKGVNVSFLVGWAFAIAASANFPSIIMLLFWKKTTAKGITASISTGIVSALTIILISPQMFEKYGADPLSAPLGLNNPGLISITLSFIVLIVVSLLTQKDNKNKKAPI